MVKEGKSAHDTWLFNYYNTFFITINFSLENFHSFIRYCGAKNKEDGEIKNSDSSGTEEERREK